MELVILGFNDVYGTCLFPFVMFYGTCDVGMGICLFSLWCLWNLWSWDVMIFMELVYFLFDDYGTCDVEMGTCDVEMGTCLIPLSCLRNLWYWDVVSCESRELL